MSEAADTVGMKRSLPIIVILLLLALPTTSQAASVHHSQLVATWNPLVSQIAHAPKCSQLRVWPDGRIGIIWTKSGSSAPTEVRVTFRDGKLVPEKPLPIYAALSVYGVSSSLVSDPLDAFSIRKICTRINKETSRMLPAGKPLPEVAFRWVVGSPALYPSPMFGQSDYDVIVAEFKRREEVREQNLKIQMIQFLVHNCDSYSRSLSCSANPNIDPVIAAAISAYFYTKNPTPAQQTLIKYYLNLPWHN